MKKIIKLATRNSPLALKQADLVKQIMSKNCEIKIVPMTSSGDTVSKNVFKQHGGKGLFLKELEESLLSKKCDIAVHSLKDVPATLNNKFRIVSISEREDSADARHPGLVRRPKTPRAAAFDPNGRGTPDVSALGEGYQVQLGEEVESVGVRGEPLSSLSSDVARLHCLHTEQKIYRRGLLSR